MSRTIQLKTHPNDLKKLQRNIILKNTLEEDEVYKINSSGKILVDKEYILKVVEDLITLYDQKDPMIISD